MDVKQQFASFCRTVVPARYRARIRGTAPVGFLLRHAFGGARSRPFPNSDFRFYFDGYRNLVFLASNLYEFESAERSLVSRRLHDNPPRCAWDIGANVGFQSLFLSSIEPKIPMIICFEPDETNLKYLKMNRDRNGLGDRWLIREIGLSDKKGTAEFHCDVVTGGTGSLEADHDLTGKLFHIATKPVQIPIGTVDDEVASGAMAPDFIKIDVEGHELSVLRGAEKTLRANRPAILFEVTRDAEEIGAFLTDLGYQLLDPATGQSLELPASNTFAVPAA